ncbi:hypothetical protein LJC19_04915 [Oxalobacter sp. OttesenSCG-928-P03]|nr:hypothetical protein [Oxalobacter sp. OttesenSCG-928-P03]
MKKPDFKMMKEEFIDLLYEQRREAYCQGRADDPDQFQPSMSEDSSWGQEAKESRKRNKKREKEFVKTLKALFNPDMQDSLRNLGRSLHAYAEENREDNPFRLSDSEIVDDMENLCRELGVLAVRAEALRRKYADLERESDRLIKRDNRR